MNEFDAANVKEILAEILDLLNSTTPTVVKIRTLEDASRMAVLTIETATLHGNASASIAATLADAVIRAAINELKKAKP